MKILNGIYITIKTALYILINPFEALTIKKETNHTSEFMGRNFWLIVIFSLIGTGIIMFLGYYDSIFKDLIGW